MPGCSLPDGGSGDTQSASKRSAFEEKKMIPSKNKNKNRITNYLIAHYTFPSIFHSWVDNNKWMIRWQISVPLVKPVTAIE